MNEHLATFTDKLLRRLRLRHIELLRTLGDVPTVRLAAEQMNLSQPAISKMLQEVEAVCGSRLFERGRRGIEPNAAGQLLIRHARILVNQLDYAGQQLQSLDGGAATLLHVGSPSTFPLLSRAIVRLRQQVPQVLVRLSEQPPRHLIARLMDGELDCVVAPLPPETLGSEDALQLRLEKIMSDRLCVVASPKHPLAKAKKLHWRDLAKESWVLSPPDALTRQRFMGACLEHGITPPSPVIECISFAPIQWLLRSDASLLALMRHYQVADDAALGLISVLPVSPGVQLPDVSLITRRDGAGYPDAVAGLLAALRYSVRNVV